MLVAQCDEHTLGKRIPLFAAGVGGKASTPHLTRGEPGQGPGDMFGHALRV